MKRNILNSPRLLELKRKRRNAFLSKILLGVFIFGLLITGLTYISSIKKLNIKNINISGNKVVDSEMVKELVVQELEGKYLGFLSKTNFLIYPKNKIKRQIEENFKRFKEVFIKTTDPETLQIIVSEREALYTWCGAIILEIPSEEEVCYFLDDIGYKFDAAPYFSKGVYVKFYGSLDGFQDLVYFKNEAEIMGLLPEAIYKEPGGDVQIFLKRGSILPEGPKILLKSDTDFKKAAENLQAALSTEPLLTDFKQKYSKLEYLDLRYGNKVYFKFNE